MRIFANLLLVIISIHHVSAQSINFDRITLEDGLIHEHILCMQKDSKGFMWFGTYGSIERFDGYEHRHYQNNMNREFGITNYSIHCIFQNDDQNFYIGTQGGMFFYNWEIDSFVSYTHDPNNNNTISSDNIRSIVSDSQSNLWIGTYGGWLSIFNPTTNKFYQPNNTDYNLKEKFGKINKLYIDNKGTLWIGTEGQGLLEYDINKERIITQYKADTHKDSLKSDVISDIIEDSNGNLWIGTWDGGFSKFNVQKRKFTTYNPIRNQDNSKIIVRSLVFDSDSNLWLATFGEGLIKFNPNKKEFTIFKNDPFNPNSISNNNLWSLYYDDNQVLWVGTFGSGVCKFDKNKHKFPHYRKNSSDKKTLTSNNISSILVDHKNKVYLGTQNNGLNIFDPDSKEITPLKTINNYNLESVNCLFEDSEKRIWAGISNGLMQIDKTRQNIKIYYHNKNDSNSITHYVIECINEDDNGNIWLGTWSSGIYVLPKQETYKPSNRAKFINYIHNPKDSTSLAWDIVWHIYKDSKENLWIGTDKGLDKFNKSNNTFVHYPYQMVSSIAEDNNGMLWLGTFGFGLYCYNPIVDTAQVFLEKDGLPNTVFLGLLTDNDKNIWASTEKGLVKILPDKKEFITFTDNDGLQSNKFNYNAYAKGIDNTLYFGGNNGFNEINPSLAVKDSCIPPIEFTDFKLFNKNVSFENATPENAILKKLLALTDTIILQHNQNFFSLKFAALSISNANEISYKYMLKGFDKNFHYTTADNREVTYTNLNPGLYHFIVKSTNKDGIWVENTKTLVIRIVPAWYQTLWFKTLLFIVIAFLLLQLYNFRLRQIRKRNIYLEDTIKERTREISNKNEDLKTQTQNLAEVNTQLLERQARIEEQSKELSQKNNELKELNVTKDKLFSIIAHDLKNPFNSLLGFVDLLRLNRHKWPEEKLDKAVHIISNSSRNIYSLLDNLLQWSRSQANQIKYNPCYIPIFIIVEQNIKLLNDNYTLKNITVNNNIKSNYEVFVDEDMFDAIIRNIFSNAIKYTPEEGTITFSASTSHDKITISISDTGFGIPEKIKNNLFDLQHTTSYEGTQGEKGTGLGLVICKEFMSKNDGKITFESSPEKGTVFHLTFKRFRTI